MNQDELIKLLSAHEWNDVEFKEAQQAVPKNAYETVSAFANTAGGHLVFGVSLRPGQGHRQCAGAATGPAGYRRPGHPNGDEETL